MIGIYKLTSPSGKSYIGQSNNIELRMKNYKSNLCKNQTRLYNAINKYGFDNFSIEYIKIVEYYISEDKIQEFLNRYEIYYIKKYDTIENGYNLRSGGSRGRHSQESKNKISNANRNRIFSIEHKQKLSDSHIGYIVPKSQRDKISIRSKKIGISLETRSKMIESRKGYRPTIETLEKSSKAHIRNCVLQFDLDGNFIKEWECAVYAAKELGFTVSSIYACCNNQQKYHNGYIWKYKNNDL